MAKDQYVWREDSGTWAQAVSDPFVFRLVAGPDERPVNDKIALRDVWHLVGASALSGKHAEPDQPRFPRGFRHHPMTGQPLVPAPIVAPRPWVPPYGAPGPEVLPRGIRRTAEPLRVVIDEQAPAQARGVASARRPDVKVPSEGSYEFVVGRFGAWADSLLALDRVGSRMYAWMAASEKWLQLTLPDDMPNLDWASDGDRWGMELLQAPVEGFGTATAYVPAHGGLARLEPRVLSLDCQAQLVCRGELCGAPVAWAGQVWVPMAAGTSKGGQAGRGGMLVCNERGDELPVEGAPGAVELRPPVSSARQVVWPAVEGQLVLERGEGRQKARWLPWPQGFVPRFECGAPYVDKSAGFWQFGWVEAQARFEYVPVGQARQAPVPAEGWRFNTGSVVYHRLTRWRHEPWKSVALPPGQQPGPDFAVPIVESGHEYGCLCLRFHPATASESAGEVLARKEKVRAELFYEGETDDLRIEIDTLQVTDPWRARLFVHDAMLWLYHPELEVLRRWSLQPVASGPAGT